MAAPKVYASFDKENPEEAEKGFSPALRCFLNKGGFNTECKDGSKTLWEIWSNGVKRHGAKQCFGSRTLTKREMVPSPDGKKQFEKLELSDYSYRSYNEVNKRVESLARSLVSSLELGKQDKILIFAETQAAWMEFALACWRQNVVVVTAYATLGADGVQSALNQTKATTIVCDAKLCGIVKECKDSCPTLKTAVIIPTKVDPAAEELQEDMGEGVKVISIEQLISTGSQASEVSAADCDPADTAVIMYTSGTTGNAKGVVISHRACVTTTRSATDYLPYVNGESTLLAYLPLAHIMELTVEFTVFHVGATLGYGNPGTLTDTGVKLKKGQKGDASLFKPTCMIFAPAVLDRVYNGVLDKVRGAGFKETLFNKALASGYANYDNGGVGASCCWNKIFGSAQALVGGRLQNMLTGSAPLSAEIQKFAQTVFNAPCRQGYGLTETCAASCIAHHTDNTVSQVGGPTPGCLIRLRDWPEGNYMNSDLNKEGVKMRRGEILIGGPMVADGYWIDETNPDAEIQAKNQEDWVTVDGVRYFCSGDVGQVTPKGQVMIVDRKKDLFKGAAGEYVSLSKVEAFVKLSPYVEMPMAYGATGQKGIIMLIVPKKGAMDKFASSKNITIGQGGYKQLTDNAEFIEEIHKSVLAECKKGKLNSFELPLATGLCIAADGSPAWSPDTGDLTTTMKLKRPTIASNFKSVIDDAYARAA